MSNYPNLPGVNMNVKDGQLLMSSNTGGNSLLIIAEAKAPAHIQIPEEPVIIRTEDQLKENFGTYFYQGELNPIAAEWKIARENGINTVYLLALEGTELKEKFIKLQEKLFGLLSDLGVSHIVLSGLYANEDIEGITSSDFEGQNIDTIEGLEVFHTFHGTKAAEGLTLLEEAPVTLKITSGVNEVTLTATEDMTANELVSFLSSEAKKAFATDGIDDLDVHFKIGEDTNAVVQATKKVTFQGTEILTALGINDVVSKMEGYGNPAVLLANYAERLSLEVGDTIAYISASAPANTNLSTIKEHVGKLTRRNNAISKYLQVVAGPQVGITVPGSLRTQWVSGVTQYACLVNSLQPQIAPTNQTLPGAAALRYNLSLRQLNDLVGNKYVTFRVKNNRIVVVDAVTTAPDLFVGEDVVKSDFTRLSTLRITNYMVRAIREACDAFIGLPNEFPVYNSMNTAIKAVIKDSIDRSIIQDARYSIDLGNSLDTATINITILPQFELRTIDVSIGLSTPTNFNVESTTP